MVVINTTANNEESQTFKLFVTYLTNILLNLFHTNKRDIGIF